MVEPLVPVLGTIGTICDYAASTVLLIGPRTPRRQGSISRMAGARRDLTILRYLLIRDTNDADRIAWAERMSMVFDGTPTRWLGFVGIVNDGRGFLPEERSEIRPNVIRRPNELQEHTKYFNRVLNMEPVSQVTAGVLFRRSGAWMVFLWLRDTSARHLKRLGVPFWSILLILARRMTELYNTNDLRLRWEGRVRRMTINEAMTLVLGGTQ
ncbi:hypothetical protein CBR_g39797 [Chara braunii]|uniref:Uncharacterized protein n=1 Tax=Chara braunii TaxID=69332 RepID=A0A388LSI1_CHABU|nr:hypothetical protein CBR_g39797 [Chara braunii]|eukprot:GBG85231.1 hypothetical protein CBR_g39797 [Chara braunii]